MQWLLIQAEIQSAGEDQRLETLVTTEERRQNQDELPKISQHQAEMDHRLGTLDDMRVLLVELVKERQFKLPTGR